MTVEQEHSAEAPCEHAHAVAPASDAWALSPHAQLRLNSLAAQPDPWSLPCLRLAPWLRDQAGSRQPAGAAGGDADASGEDEDDEVRRSVRSGVAQRASMVSRA